MALWTRIMRVQPLKQGGSPSLIGVSHLLYPSLYQVGLVHFLCSIHLSQIGVQPKSAGALLVATAQAEARLRVAVPKVSMLVPVRGNVLDLKEDKFLSSDVSRKWAVLEARAK